MGCKALIEVFIHLTVIKFVLVGVYTSTISHFVHYMGVKWLGCVGLFLALAISLCTNICSESKTEHEENSQTVESFLERQLDSL